MTVHQQTDIEEFNTPRKSALVSHLISVRNTSIKCLSFIIVIFISLFYFSNDLYQFIAEPLQAFLPENGSMIAMDVTSPFLTPLKLTFLSSILISIPFIFYQIFNHLSDKLFAEHRKLAAPLLLLSIGLFYAGIGFAYFVVFPLVFGFFTSVGPESVQVMTDISRYLDFVIKLIFAFGIAFQIPIATLLLIISGISTYESLTNKRPYIIVGCFITGMLLTPPDIISQSLLAIPMWFLFEAGLILSKILLVQNKKKRCEDSA